MFSILGIKQKYSGKLEYLDLDLIIAHVLGKNREFVLAHPEKTVNRKQEAAIKKLAARRMNHEPLAYILGEKEFYGLKFKVNKNVLIPRPETELMVDLVSHSIKHEPYNNKKEKIIIADVGTGSGNIIIATAWQLHNLEFRISNFEFFGIDISKKALQTAKQNAKFYKLDKKIKFLHGNLLDPVLNSKNYPATEGSRQGGGKLKSINLIITANLPYLSPRIYASCSKDIKKFEPKSALISQKEGLAHYEELFKQITNSQLQNIVCFLEISPEQKPKITKLIKKYFIPPAGGSKIIFHKDLAGKWRICQILVKN